MIGMIARLFAGPIIDAVTRVFVASQNKKATEAEMRAEVEKAIMQTIADVSHAQADVIKAEAQGESWLQRCWRPVTALAFASVILFYGIVLPIAVDWFGMPRVRVGDTLLSWIMQAVMLCLGGYIGGRTLEKITDSILTTLRK